MVNYNSDPFKTSFNNYFDQTPAGTTQTFGGVKLTKNANGTATLTTIGNGDQTLDIDRNTDPNAIAQWAPGIRAEWDKAFTSPTTPTPSTTPTTQDSYSPDNYQGMIRNAYMPTNQMRTVTQDETVQGRLNGMLSANSPYLQAAVQNARTQLGGRGMLNSSLENEAAAKAAIEAAAPIAAQDASTSAASGLSAQNANQDLNSAQYNASLKSIGDTQALQSDLERQRNAGDIQQSQTRLENTLLTGRMGEQERLNEKQAGKQNELDIEKAGKQNEFDIERAGKQSEFNMNEETHKSGLTQIEDTNRHNLIMAEKEFDANFELEKMSEQDKTNFANAVAPIWQQYVVGSSQINSQSDYNIYPQEKLDMINQLRSDTKSSIESIASIYGVSIEWTPEVIAPAQDVQPFPFMI